MQGHVNLVRSVKSFVSGLKPGRARFYFSIIIFKCKFQPTVVCCKNKNEAISVITHKVRTQSNNPIVFLSKWMYRRQGREKCERVPRAEP